jgi:hypothetical protein
MPGVSQGIALARTIGTGALALWVAATRAAAANRQSRNRLKTSRLLTA